MSRIQPLRQHIPNLLTLCNLAFGFVSVLLAFENHLLFASWLILLSALFDFLDGFAAKLLGAVSEFGKQLDSLADIISFGMAPGAIVYKLMEYALRNESLFSGLSGANLVERIYLFSPMLIVLFAAIRLAAFNIRKNSSGFVGLATPAAAIFFAGLVFDFHLPSAIWFHQFPAAAKCADGDYIDHQFFDDSQDPNVLPEVPRIRMERK